MMLSKSNRGLSLTIRFIFEIKSDPSLKKEFEKK